MKLSVIALLLVLLTTATSNAFARDRDCWDNHRYSGYREYRSDWRRKRPVTWATYHSDFRDSHWGRRNNFRRANWSGRNMPPRWAVARGWHKNHPQRRFVSNRW